MKSLATSVVCVYAALALIGCGSSSDEASSPSPASTKTPVSAQDAASEVCDARDGIQSQVQTLSSLSAGSATKAEVTSALSAIQTDLQKMKAAQPDLAPDRKQQVQEATTAFGTELRDIVRQTVAGLSKTDAQTQATNAAASLESAVKNPCSRSIAEAIMAARDLAVVTSLGGCGRSV